MDKFTRDFFNSILNDGGSPVYSTAPGKIKSSLDVKEGFKKLGNYFLSKAKPAEKIETNMETVEPVAGTNLPMVSQEEGNLPKSGTQ